MGPKGISLLALAFAIVAITIQSISGVEPVKEVYDTASSIVTDNGLCPSGWASQVEEADHIVVRRCERGEYIVVLNDDGTCNYGGRKEEINGVTYMVELQISCSAIPQWR